MACRRMAELAPPSFSPLPPATACRTALTAPVGAGSASALTSDAPERWRTGSSSGAVAVASRGGTTHSISISTSTIALPSPRGKSRSLRVRVKDVLEEVVVPAVGETERRGVGGGWGMWKVGINQNQPMNTWGLTDYCCFPSYKETIFIPARCTA